MVAAQKLECEAFAQAHGGFYLLRRAILREDSGASLPFDTIQTPLASFDEDVPATSPVCQLARIQKRPENPYPERISVGRATNCDVVLRHATISKLHAHFTTASDGCLRVSDLASTNGTSVNDAPLAAHASTALTHGDRIRFGDLECELVGPSDLWAFLRG